MIFQDLLQIPGLRDDKLEKLFRAQLNQSPTLTLLDSSRKALCTRLTQAPRGLNHHLPKTHSDREARHPFALIFFLSSLKLESFTALENLQVGFGNASGKALSL